MATLTKFFWKNSVSFKDTYLYHIPSEALALEMARTLQGASSADLYMIDYTPSGVCLPSSTGRRYEYEIKPTTQKPTLTAYKRAGEGAGLGVFWVVYLSGGNTRIALSAPSPRYALIDSPADMQALADTWRRAYQNAVKVSGLSVSCYRVIAPKEYRKSFDGVVWYPKK